MPGAQAYFYRGGRANIVRPYIRLGVLAAFPECMKAGRKASMRFTAGEHSSPLH